MPLTDSRIRINLIKALKLLEKSIMDYELPLTQYGFQGSEYFSREGSFGKKNGKERHWIALIAVADEKKDLGVVFQSFRDKFQ